MTAAGEKKDGGKKSIQERGTWRKAIKTLLQRKKPNSAAMPRPGPSSLAYTITPKEILVNVLLVDNRDNTVLTSASISMARTEPVNSLLADRAMARSNSDREFIYMKKLMQQKESGAAARIPSSLSATP
jgi:hypothetical protein